tara:strand:+ start:121 stop:552 length:432 start_codon:yes stop_codon:yes gene_type:complete
MKVVQQPTKDSCTSACLAMLTGLPIDFVFSRFHDKFKAGETNAYEFLDNLDFEYQRQIEQYRIGGDPDGWAYLLAVPSLNEFATMHNLIVYTSQGQLHVLDPQRGVEGKFFYETLYSDYVGIGHQLTGFSPELKMYVGDRLDD